MTDHLWTHENLDAYLAGGLTPDERGNVEQHIEACAECAQTLAATRKLEHLMADIFAKDRPDAGLEERALAKLRKSRINRATALRFFAAAAAVLVLGLVGAAMQAIAFGERGSATNNLRQRGLVHVHDVSSSMDLGLIMNSPRQDGKETFNVVDVDPSNFDGDVDIKYVPDRISEVSVPGSVSPKEFTGLLDGKASKRLTGEVATGKSDGRVGGEGFSGKKPPAMPLPSMLGLGMPKLDDSLKDLANLTKLGANVNGRTDLGRTDKAERGFENTFAFGLPANKGGYYTPPENAKPPVDSGPPAKKDPKTSGGSKKSPPDGPPMPGNGESPDGGEKPPAEQARKIIRTGDMEFEIDSFDDAAATVNRLIDAVQGGFVATVNSDKLPNGKMRGSIVVRMPPQFLDKFLLDLRRELGKTGELKSQRIGSQDVTKHFTDTESELKAARTVEARLLDIIKTGKGEIKDLIVAENQLGIWRTKIEKMEGEIRSLRNQVALSTLTITLYEKEIQAPSALVVTDHITMRVEVEEVAKAHQAALDAVKSLKGRITRSEVKLHKAGQLEAILHAEILPASKDAFRDQLKKLGIVSAHEETQRQQAEGGTGQFGEIKTRVNPVQFEVTLNNIVNIPPRHSVSLAIATADVPGNFAKLQEAIRAIPKGQIRNAQIIEKDKQNVAALLEFNIPIEEKAKIDDLIEKVGPVLTRAASQTLVTELSTDKKFGYSLALSSVANVPPREVVTLKIEVKDVDAEVAEMKKMVIAGNGRIADANVARGENGQVTATLVFDVPIGVEDLLVSQIKKAGNLLSQQTTRNPNVPENNLATAQLAVTLSGVFAGKQPREKIALKIEVPDVEAKATEMRDQVRAIKGRVVDEKSGRHANGQVGALLVFDVPLSAMDGLVQQFKKSGYLVSYDTSRNANVPENELASAQIVVVLNGAAPIVPSDESHLRRALTWSFTVFSWCLVAIVTALAAVVPIGLTIFILYWVISKAWPSDRTKLPTIGNVKGAMPESKPSEGDKPMGNS